MSGRVTDGGAGAPRLAAIDVARGAAIVAMVIYHLSWDLGNFRLVPWNAATDPGWRIFARLIATSFLVLVGVSLVLASRNGFRLKPYLRRLAIIVGAAALVSLGTWWSTPDAFVFFGILHMIAAGSVLALPFLFAPSWIVAIAAIVAILAPTFLASPVFDAPALWWLGLSPTPPRSVDFVPVLPWFGAVLAGLLIGRAMVAAGPNAAFARWRGDGRLAGALAFTGRWSLLIYLVHQPLLIGALSLAAPHLPVSKAAETRNFTGDCVAACRKEGVEPPVCELYCGCMYEALLPTGLIGADQRRMTAEQSAAWNGIVTECRRQAAAFTPRPPP
jgi:uncharacterized membrane protein